MKILLRKYPCAFDFVACNNEELPNVEEWTDTYNPVEHHKVVTILNNKTKACAYYDFLLDNNHTIYGTIS